MTKNRQAILDVLQTDCNILSAADIHEQLPHMDLTTIYRTLDLFTEHGLIKKLTFDEQEARYEYQHTPHHHAVCRECHRVLHVTFPDDSIKAALAEEGFTPETVDITIKGVCDHKTTTPQRAE